MGILHWLRFLSRQQGGGTRTTAPALKMRILVKNGPSRTFFLPVDAACVSLRRGRLKPVLVSSYNGDGFAGRCQC
jgi:hypothetical protein